jgi:hypothetical protein
MAVISSGVEKVRSHVHMTSPLPLSEREGFIKFVFVFQAILHFTSAS